MAQAFILLFPLPGPLWLPRACRMTETGLIYADFARQNTKIVIARGLAMRGTATRRQSIPVANAHDAALLVRLANEARGHLREGKRRPHKRAIKEIEQLARRLGAKVVAHGDLSGMVVGLEWPDRPNPRQWTYLA